MYQVMMMMSGKILNYKKTNPLLDSRLESGLGPDRAEPELRDPDPATFF